ncbi:MAG: membrane protein insertion efficiency factor YidD [Desulfobacterales bacterium]
MIKNIVLYFIRFYQIVISPFIGPVCRFYPSCSEYAFIAINQHGLIKGIFLAFKRILRCHPFNPGGIDQVPKKTNT